MSQLDKKAAQDFVEHLRKNPDDYKALRDQLKQASTEQERVDILLDFATSDEQLARLAPAKGPGGQTQLAWTTVTITIIFIPDTAY